MHVFLVHGMGRTHRSLALLALRFERGGLSTSRFGYDVRRETLAEIAARFTEHVRTRAGGAPYGIVGHSLGNVIARLASPALPTGLSGLVMLAPPNRPPILATLMRDRLLFRALARDAGQRLADPAFYEALPVPAVPTLVFAGTAGPRAHWLPFRGAASDGVVAVDETPLEGAEHRTVPALHTFIMNDARVAAEALAFLRRGSADAEDAPPVPARAPAQGAGRGR